MNPGPFIFNTRALTILLMLLPAFSWAEVDEELLKRSIVNVNGYEGRSVETQGTGFVVHSDRYNGYVVTNADLVQRSDTVTVNVPWSGGELVAQAVDIDEALDVAILKVNGLELPWLLLAGEQPETGDVVWSAVKWARDSESLGLAKGSLRSHYRTPDGNAGVFQHTAMIAEGGVGSVLLNNCGHVLGVNMGLDSGDGNVRAIDASSLRRMLAAQSIKSNVASGGCVSAVALAREKAEAASREAQHANAEAVKAQEAARSLEAKLEKSAERNEELVSQSREARQRADEAIAAAEAARQNAEDTRLELERRTSTMRAEAKALIDRFEEDQIQAQQRFQEALNLQNLQAKRREWMIIGTGVLLFAVGAIGVFVFRRRTPARSLERDSGGGKRSNTEMHNLQNLSEYVLDGRDEDGIRYLLRISGDQLTSDEGVIIGRNPKDSPYIINHADVSRKHARIKVMKNRVFIEDLGSTNGTSVNGQSIDDKGPVSVNDGDQIIIGSVVMKLRVLAA